MVFMFMMMVLLEQYLLPIKKCLKVRLLPVYLQEF
ncbi:Uncharacterised protein [Bacteroides uniformis]|uniref:Uncharacterized protein n=1 Tax=Bacteroides uniformis TaxID=820 RepID=A0A174FB99_BACUN|nr:hypothetical protein HMPREF1072_03229 [Bacteroides uniformis CL03T00C23]EIY78811.1 hypothetical protein HMPREF1073_01901 [Bacteroides uniformis CL03T12C37]CUO47463.1 Uncharacterised protein [Bacteroides uniformis]